MADNTMEAAFDKLWRSLKEEERDSLEKLAAFFTLNVVVSIEKVDATHDLEIPAEAIKKLTNLGFLRENGAFLCFASIDILNFVKTIMMAKHTT